MYLITTWQDHKNNTKRYSLMAAADWKSYLDSGGIANLVRDNDGKVIELPYNDALALKESLIAEGNEQ